MKRAFRLYLVPVVLLLCPAVVQAELLGLMNGRSVDPARLPDTSVEAGVVTGETLEERDYQYFGARFNYRASPELMLYGDVGQVEVDFGVDFDGTSFGVGGYYVLDGVFQGSDFAVKASYHRASTEASEASNDIDLDVIVVEAVLSGREGFGAEGNLGWYANIGMHRIGADANTGDSDSDDTETELGFGGGIVIPNASGEFYLGVDIIDEMNFGGGFRYFLQ